MKKIVNICLKNGWLLRDPFLSYRMSKKEVVREILTEEEIQVVSIGLLTISYHTVKAARVNPADILKNE